MASSTSSEMREPATLMKEWERGEELVAGLV
jgi:hypothetical protein